MFGFGEKVPQITPTDLANQLKETKGLFVVDVRTVAEFRTGHIPGAKLIPLGELGQRSAEIPQDSMVVTVCRSGARSLMAARQLKKMGYNVYNMTGGMMKWTDRTVK